ncbi:PSEA-binding protein 95kD [Carabus blaptoides fortunei]
MDTIDDLNKLTKFLNNKKASDSSDVESVDSVEIIHDYKIIGEKIHEPSTSHHHNTLWQSNGEFYNKGIQKFVESCTDSLIKNAVSNEIIQQYERSEDKLQESSYNKSAQDNRDKSCSEVVASRRDPAVNVVSNDVKKQTNTSNSENSITDEEQEIIDSCRDPVLLIALKCNVEKRRILKQLYLQFQLQMSMLDEHTVRQTDGRVHRCNLGIPYFKDKFSFPSRPNEDFIKLKKAKQLSHRKNPMRRWTASDKNKLAKAVYKEICRKKLEHINEEIVIFKRADNEGKTTANILANMIKERNILNDSKLIERLAVSWMKNTTFTSNANQVTTYNTISKPSEYERERLNSEKLIIETVSKWIDIDWNRMAVQVLNGRHTETECRGEWSCYMNPRFNKHPWTRSEKAELRMLARKYNNENWEAIGGELNRSALQCCVHFHTRLCERYSGDRWTQQEDEMLMETIKLCVNAEGDIQWGSVAYFFRNRTKVQIYNRYTYCLAPTLKKGLFSIPEDILLVVLARLYKNNFRKIQSYFPDRHLPQLRSHFLTMRMNNLQQWTVEEDAKVIEHVQIYGTKYWSKLNLKRTAHCIRHRYFILKHWFEAHPDGKLQDIKRRRLSNWHSRKVRRNYIIDFIVEKLWTQIQNTTDNQQQYLSISHIDSLLNEVPEYKKQRSRRKAKSKPKTGTIDEMLKNFFKPTFKFMGRTRSIITNETVQESTDRTEMILEVLQANLKLPSLDQLAEQPLLNDLDKRVLEQLVIRKKSNVHAPLVNNGASTSQVQSMPVQVKDYTFPVNAESLVGFRSLLLHYSTLVQHSKCRYDGYLQYLDKAMNQMYVGTDTSTKEMSKYMHIPDDNIHKVQIRSERELFTNRFFQLFKWACFMCEIKTIPGIEPAAHPQVEIECKKLGRPKKKANYKVELMNIARSRKRKQENVNMEANTDKVEHNSNTTALDQDILELPIKKVKTTKLNVTGKRDENDYLKTRIIA